jgi:hypothetical protein
MRDRAAWIQWLLKDLDRLEAMAAAAQPSEVHHSRWAGLSSVCVADDHEPNFILQDAPEVIRRIRDVHVDHAVVQCRA